MPKAYAIAKYNNGVRLLAAGKLDEAVGAFTAALDIDSTLEQAHAKRAEALSRLERVPEAEADLEQARRPAPGRQAFCADCGHGNPTDAWFCGNCRRRLRKPKRHWLAALLNVIPLVIGYLYVRRPKRFAATLLIGPLAVFASVFLAFLYLLTCLYGCSGTEESVAILILFSLPLLVTAVTVWDAWRIASEGQ